MEKDEKFQSFDKLRIDPEQSRIGQREKRGRPEYINENCWLAKTLKYSPGERCRRCESKFYNCLFFQYLITSLILIFFLLGLSFLIEGKIPKLVVISIFVLVIVYGYFFNKSTEKIIKANFGQIKANEDLEELTKNLEKRVEEQTKNIDSLSKMKSEFLRIVNHQLRTPVSIIKGMISFLVEKGLSEEQKKEFITNLYFSSERLSIILDDILIAQDLVGGIVSNNLSLCQIEKIIEEVVESFKIQADKKNLKILFKKPEKPPSLVLIDRGKIKKSLSRLIDNAILYTKKGEVVVEVDLIKNEKDFLQIKVKDTGIGLTDKDKEKLFEIFSRGEGAKLHLNGSGLGLYIAKEYISAHQGKIKAESEGRNKGTTFVITLPAIIEI